MVRVELVDGNLRHVAWVELPDAVTLGWEGRDHSFPNVLLWGERCYVREYDVAFHRTYREGVAYTVPVGATVST